MSNFYRPSTLTVDIHTQKYYEEDEGSILDDNILDPNAINFELEIPVPEISIPWDSSTVSSLLFLPKTSLSDSQQVDMLPVASNNPFLEQNHNPFVRANSQAYRHQGYERDINHVSHMNTSMQTQDGLPSPPNFQGTVRAPIKHPDQIPGYKEAPLVSLDGASNESILSPPLNGYAETSFFLDNEPSRIVHSQDRSWNGSASNEKTRRIGPSDALRPAPSP
jgi:hypothetical protein